MGMTITEKILANAAGKDKVSPGDLVNARIDVIMCHDVTTPPAISMLKEHGIDRVFDPEKIVVTPDHFQPAKDIKAPSFTNASTHGPGKKALSTTTRSEERAFVMLFCPSRAIFARAR